MASTLRPPTPDDVVGKVLRRAEVAKVGYDLDKPRGIDDGELNQCLVDGQKVTESSCPSQLQDPAWSGRSQLQRC